MNSFPGKARNPYDRTNSVAMNPAIGPATPMSNITFLEGIADFVLMTAPRVPKLTTLGRVGNGIKYGKVASTP